MPEPAGRRNDEYGRELEAYFRQYLVEDYPGRTAGLWNRRIVRAA
jgi:hypothetical protein